MDEFEILLKVFFDEIWKPFLKTLQFRELILFVRVEYLMKQIGHNLVFIEVKVGFGGKI